MRELAAYKRFTVIWEKGNGNRMKRNVQQYLDHSLDLVMEENWVMFGGGVGLILQIRRILVLALLTSQV